MTGLTELLVPILLSAVLVFVASSIIHMLSPWHKSDFPRLAREDEFRAAVGPLDLPPGDYMVPRAYSTKEMQSAEFLAKMEQGPNVIMTVMPKGKMTMTQSLVLWFFYILAMSIAAAYVAGRALAPGADYLQVFRFVTTTAFLGYSAALLQMSIWYKRAWNITIKSMIDGFIYATLTAGMMGWLWPA
jgi:hypothetical protein